MSTTKTTNTTASTTFIDLATFSELESFVYGGKDAVTLFISSVQKANWFSFIPVSLRHVSGTPNFGAENVAASVNRSGDYVLNAWFRATIPRIGLRNNGGTPFRPTAGVAWCRNLMHNLIQKCQISFNELIVQEFDNYYLDVVRQYKVPAAKQAGYDNMIGNVATMTSLGGNIYAPGGSPLRYAVGDGTARMIPLPFFFAEDSGVALPVAALPFNDIKINYIFRELAELVVVFPGSGPAAAGFAYPGVGDVVVWSDNESPTTTTPSLIRPETFVHYVVVHNDERVKMGDAARDILITQNQTASPTLFNSMDSQSFDLRFSHSIVALFYMAENTSLKALNGGNYGRECSNYTTQSAFALDDVAGTFAPIQSGGSRFPSEGSDPFSFTELQYENTSRYAMGSDYYMWVAPYYFSDSIPTETGYHCISYSLNMWSQDPMGSTNYSKLANVSLIHTGSEAAKLAVSTTTPTGVDAAGGSTVLYYLNSTGVPTVFPQRFTHICIAINRNIARAANGSLGHPTL
jgi:hypothetical protein